MSKTLLLTSHQLSGCSPEPFDYFDALLLTTGADLCEQHLADANAITVMGCSRSTSVVPTDSN